MPTKLHNLCIKTIGSVDLPANPKAQVVLMKRHNRKEEPHLPRTIEEILKGLAQEDQTVVHALQTEAAKVSELQKKADQVPELEQKIAELTPEPTEDELMKSMPESLRKSYMAMKKASEDATALAQQEVEKRETGEFIAKAAAYTHLPIKADEFGPVMRKMAKAITADEFSKFDALLKAANETAKQSKLFEEFGKGGGGAPVGASEALAKLDAAAAEIQKKAPKLTNEQAFAQACTDHPELYTAYENELKGGN